MKRILILLSVCLMTSVVLAQNAGIMVSVNKGKDGLKFFRSNQLMEAIEAAEINDTIYFTAGSFDFYQLPDIDGDYYKREWSKPLVVIGAGAQEEGGTSVSMPGTLFLNFEGVPSNQRNISFEGIYVPNEICQLSDINELAFRNFRGYTIFDVDDITKKPEDADENWNGPLIESVILKSCQLEEINFNWCRAQKIQVSDSKINNVSGNCRGNQTFTIDHCRIGNLTDWFTGLIQNSLISRERTGPNGTAQIDNCGIYSSDNNVNSTRNNCISITDFNVFGDDSPTPLNGGSLALDGETTMGTTSAFSLYPSYPTLDVKKSEIDYDSINKQISIKVELLGDKNEAANEQ